MKDIIPDVAEPLTGYRVFKPYWSNAAPDAYYQELFRLPRGSSGPTRPRLKAYSNDMVWLPGPNDAACTSPPRAYTVLRNEKEGDGVELVDLWDSSSHTRIPDPGCNCGFWCFKELDELLASSWGDAPDVVVGKVMGWGRTVHHRDGYRFEKAQVVELYETGGYDLKDLYKVGKEYDIPVVSPPKSAGWAKWLKKEDGSALGLTAGGVYTVSNGGDVIITGSGGGGTSIHATTGNYQLTAEQSKSIEKAFKDREKFYGYTATELSALTPPKPKRWWNWLT